MTSGKNQPVFDCDAHVKAPGICSDSVEPCRAAFPATINGDSSSGMSRIWVVMLADPALLPSCSKSGPSAGP